MSGPRPVRAARGTDLRCRGWLQEAALRCLENNLDPEVAEDPDRLVVYGGSGRAARSWGAFDAIVTTLRDLGDDETLLVQSGKPVGVFTTHPMAPRVLIANSLLVPDWADWDTFWELEAEGLLMYGQMTAGSWIYIGTQGILQGTYQTFATLAEQAGWGDLSGRLVLTAGLGGMGGAQPLAITMNRGVALCVEVDGARMERRLQTRYLDLAFDSLDEALDVALEHKRTGRPRSIGVLGNAAEIVPELLSRGVDVDVVTDQTPAHDPKAYVPAGYDIDEAAELRDRDPRGYVKAARGSMATHCEALVGFQRAGAEVFDYGNNLRGEAREGGFADAFSYPGFVPAYLRPLFCEGKGPFRWVALSGDPADIAATDRVIAELFPEDDALQRWLELAHEQVAFQGLPSRICWLGYGERDRAGLAFNELVASGEVSAPIVIGRDHLDSGSVASPYRETEAMADGSDAIADWPILNALLNTASGAAWVAVHHGGGVGIGKSIHAGAQVVADGSDEAAGRLRRVLTNDPGSGVGRLPPPAPGRGVARHPDAGYDRAREVARERGVRIPMSGSDR